MHIPANFTALEAVPYLRGDAAPRGMPVRGVIHPGSRVAAGEGRGGCGGAGWAGRGCTAARRSELSCTARPGQRGDRSFLKPASL